MKQTLLAPLRYFLLFMLFILVFTVISVILAYAQQAGTVIPEEQPFFLIVTLVAVKDSLFWASVFALISQLFSILRRAEHRWLSLLLIFILSTSIFTFTYFALEDGMKQFGAVTVPVGYTPGVILQSEEGTVRIRESEPLFAKGVLYWTFEQDENSGLARPVGGPSDNEYRLQYLAEAPFNPLNGDLVLGRSGSFDMTLVRNSRNSLFNESEILRPFFEILSSINNVVQEYASDGLSVRYILLCLAVFFYLINLWVFVRLTRWAFFNLSLCLAMFALLAVMIQLAGGDILANLLGDFIQPRMYGYIIPGLIGSIGLIFLIVSLLLPSLSKVERDLVG